MNTKSSTRMVRCTKIQELDTASVNADQERDWTSKDSVLAKVKSFVLRGWPDRVDDVAIKPYFKRKLEFSEED